VSKVDQALEHLVAIGALVSYQYEQGYDSNIYNDDIRYEHLVLVFPTMYGGSNATLSISTECNNCPGNTHLVLNEEEDE